MRFTQFRQLARFAPSGNDRARSLYWPVGVWFLLMAAFVAIVVESLFVESHAVFVYARVVTYVAGLMTAALLSGIVALFGLGCGLMLWWLDDAQPAKRIANAVVSALWVMVAYVGSGVVLLLIDLPTGLTMADLDRPDLEEDVRAVLAMRWMEKLSSVVVVVYLVVVAWRLAQSARPLNAALAVGFGAAAIAALAAGVSTFNLPGMEYQ